MKQMNKRIRGLAKQAGLTQTKWDDIGAEPVFTWHESLNKPGSLERVAQLIVDEYETVADDSHNRGFCPVGGFIKEHFTGAK